jgi:hypothetical protein
MDDMIRADVITAARAGANGAAWTASYIAEAFGCHRPTFETIPASWRRSGGIYYE